MAWDEVSAHQDEVSAHGGGEELVVTLLKRSHSCHHQTYFRYENESKKRK